MGADFVGEAIVISGGGQLEIFVALSQGKCFHNNPQVRLFSHDHESGQAVEEYS